MTNEEMQKTMQFILEQQAQFASDIGVLKERIDGITGVVSQIAAVTLNAFEAIDKKFEDVDRRISALVDAQIRTEENLSKTNEEMRNLIAVVDRYFSEGRNGKQSQ